MVAVELLVVMIAWLAILLALGEAARIALGSHL